MFDIKNLFTIGAQTKRRPMTHFDLKKFYKRDAPSFVDLIPWVEYAPQQQLFMFQDGISCGTVLEISPVDMDTANDKDFFELQTAIYNALTTIPTRRDNPYVLQFYLNDEPLGDLVTDLYNYAKADCRDSAYSQHFFKLLAEHFEIVGSEGGMFVDGNTGQPWKGKMRRIRCCLYRRFDKSELNKKGAALPHEELIEVRERFLLALEKCGVSSRIMSGKDLYAWMLPWLSPAPGKDMTAWQMMHQCPYPELAEQEGDLPADFDLAQFCVKGSPESDVENGVWLFNNMPHRYLCLQGVQVPPVCGQWTKGDKDNLMAVALFDELPEFAILAISIVFESQSEVEKHILKVSKASGGGSGLAERAKEQAEIAIDEVNSGELMFRMSHGIYLKADNQAQLDAISNKCIATVRGKFDAIEPIDDNTAVDSYRHNLPMCYNPRHAKMSLRGRLTYARHLARLLPFYGHGTGTGNYGLMYFNRIGEVLAFDPLSKYDRTKTAHALIFGPTGAGKSATMNYNQMFKMAMRNPRMFIIESGNSFGLLAEEFAKHGKSVNHVRFKKNANISIPPFANAIKALEEEEKQQRLLDADFIPEEDDEESDDRDYLGEMLQSLILMATSADLEQVKSITPQDKRTLTQSILNAAQTVRSSARETKQVIISDIVDELNQLATAADISVNRKERIKELADSVAIFTTGLRNKFFNQIGDAWPEVDVTIVDMAELSKEINKDMLAVAFISLINRISDLGEKYQFDDREIDANTDEGHIITTNPTIAPPVVYGVKTWRKLGIWLTQATQNLADYPNESEKMLNLAEWWILLNLELGDVTELKRFKDLSKEDEDLIKSCSKEIPNYTEGVVLSNKVKARFRVVQPALALTLAMTESDEKAARMELMQKHNLATELDAAYFMADEINAIRRANTVKKSNTGG